MVLDCAGALAETPSRTGYVELTKSENASTNPAANLSSSPTTAASNHRDHPGHRRRVHSRLGAFRPLGSVGALVGGLRQRKVGRGQQ